MILISNVLLISFNGVSFCFYVLIFWTLFLTCIWLMWLCYVHDERLCLSKLNFCLKQIYVYVFLNNLPYKWELYRGNSDLKSGNLPKLKRKHTSAVLVVVMLNSKLYHKIKWEIYVLTNMIFFSVYSLKQKQQRK